MHNELEHLEQRWRLALQTAAFGVWDLNPQANEVHYSPQFRGQLGYPMTDHAESTALWRARVHPDDLQPMLAALTEHLEGRAAVYETEFRLRAADGQYRWVLSRGRVVQRDAAGQPLRMVGTLTDLTDRRELEAARKAQAVAEAANRAKTEFLSRMSHELRTPLNAILGFAQLLNTRLGKADVAEQRGHVQHIEQAGWHLLHMINDVLDLSRIESGQLAMALEPVAVAPLWRFVSDMMGPTANARRVSLIAGELPADAAVTADTVRLKQVLTNLVSNAVKYNRDGGTVRLDLQRAGEQWRIAVIDTGAGLTREQQAHLFEPFNRLGRDRGGVEGVGIGLVLTRWLVERMGGSLVVSSTPGVGSCFAVELPAAATRTGSPERIAPQA